MPRITGRPLPPAQRRLMVRRAQRTFQREGRRPKGGYSGYGNPATRPLKRVA